MSLITTSRLSVEWCSYLPSSWPFPAWIYRPFYGSFPFFGLGSNIDGMTFVRYIGSPSWVLSGFFAPTLLRTGEYLYGSVQIHCIVHGRRLFPGQGDTYVNKVSNVLVRIKYLSDLSGTDSGLGFKFFSHFVNVTAHVGNMANC